MVSTTKTPAQVYPDGTPVAKADVRLMVNEMLAGTNADLINANSRMGKIYGSREDAVAVLQSQPPATGVNLIITIEGDALVVRFRTNSADDPLFPTGDRWGVIYRLGLVTQSTRGLMTASDKTKLDNIASGATANATNAQLRDRATHTGTQAISTVNGLSDALTGLSQSRADGDTALALQISDLQPPARPDAFDRFRIGTGQWVNGYVYDLIRGDRDIVFAADYTHSSELAVGVGTMDDASTYARAGSAYYIDADNRYRSRAADAPRVGDRGLMIEPARTNLFKQSINMAAAEWLKARVSVTPGAWAFAGIPAFRLADTSESGTHNINQSVSVSGGAPVTVSALAAAQELPILVLHCQGAALSENKRAVFDLRAGTATVSMGSGVAAAMVKRGDGWLCEMTFTPTSSNSLICYFMVAEAATAISYIGTGTKGLAMAAAQIEAGGYSTSIIPTTTAPVERPADEYRFSGDWWPETVGTIYMRAEAKHVPSAYLVGALSSSDSPLVMTADAGEIGSNVAASVLAARSPAETWSEGRDIEVLSSWGVSGRAIAIQNGTVVTDSTPTRDIDMVRLGARGPAGSPPLNVMCGWIKTVVVWSVRKD